MDDLPRTKFCSTIGGLYDDNGATCTIQQRSDGEKPSCYKAAAAKFFYDDLGPCFDFQRLENSVYRQRYRLTDACMSQLNGFLSNVTDKDSGLCSEISNWRGASGSFIPSQFPVVSIPQKQDARDCRVHLSKSRCEAGLCSWSNTSTYVQCMDKSKNDCIAMCYKMGGDMINGECAIPKCRPTQMENSHMECEQ